MPIEISFGFNWLHCQPTTSRFKASNVPTSIMSRHTRESECERNVTCTCSYRREMLKGTDLLNYCPDSIMGYLCIMICIEHWRRQHLCVITLSIWKVALAIIFAIILWRNHALNYIWNICTNFSFLTLINSILWLIYELFIISHFKKREE